jgi:penicillin-binding protein A
MIDYKDFHRRPFEKNVGPQKSVRPREMKHVIHYLLVSITILVSYISFNDQSTPTAEAATPDRLKLRPAPEHIADLLSSNSKIHDNLETHEPVAPKTVGSTTFPIPDLEPVTLSIFQESNRIQLRKFPKFSTEFGGQFAGKSSDGDLVYYTLEPELQRFLSGVVSRSNAPHVAAIAMDPKTGKILAIADKSKSIQNLSLHSGFPAASLFKVVTAAAAVEQSNLDVNSKIAFRGGTYTLEPWNYSPDSARDKKLLPLGEALGKSCNPVFGRVALMHLNPSILEDYSKLFGFNSNLNSDLPLPMSPASIPNDEFGLSRTGAGFGEVHISPIHAASLMSGIANGGIMPRPKLVEKIVSESGKVIYQSDTDSLSRIVQTETSRELMRMMQYTTTDGTSRKEFISKGRTILKDVDVAAKTGTLSGKNPAGLNTWFIGAAPMNNPEIAVAVIVVNPTASTKASRIGRQIIEKHLFGTVTEYSPPIIKKKYRSSKKVTTKKTTTKYVPKKKLTKSKKSVKLKSSKK